MTDRIQTVRFDRCRNKASLFTIYWRKHLNPRGSAPCRCGIMETSSILKLWHFFFSAARFAVAAMVLFVVVATNVVAQQLPESCAENHGTWLEKDQEGGYASQRWWPA